MAEQEGRAPTGGAAGRAPSAFAQVHDVRRPPHRGSETLDESERAARTSEPV